jgi:hypothetical protein
MSKQNMRTKMTVGVAALALGAVLASVPAFAQSTGRNPNDGGLITTPSGAQQSGRTLYNSAAPQTSAAPHYGRNANDGGLVDEPSGAQSTARSTPQQAPAPAQYGRNPNDGGLVR